MYISNSMLSVWSKCRKAFDFSYNQKIEPIQSRQEMLVGTFAHKALQAHFLTDDWKQALDTIRLAYTSEDDPEMIVDGDYINEVNQSAYNTEKILERYFQYYANDQFTIVRDSDGKPFIEYGFSIPYKDSKGEEHFIVGVIDLMLQDTMGNLWLMDHKFVKTKFRESLSLELDPQIAMYIWAANKLGYRALGFIYNQVIGQPEEPPKMLAPRKNEKTPKAKFSKDKSMNCSWTLYEQTLRAHGIPASEIEEYRIEMEEPLSLKVYQQRDYIYRTEEQNLHFEKNLYARVDDLVQNRNNIFMEPDRYRCTLCDFNRLCPEIERGLNVTGLISDYYQTKRKRE